MLLSTTESVPDPEGGAPAKDRTEHLPPNTEVEIGSRGTAPRRRTWIYAAVTIAIVVVMIAAAFVLTGGFHRSASSSPHGETLATDGQRYTIASGQFAGITFVTSSTATLTGTYWTTYNISVYVKMSVQYKEFVHSLNVPAYQWTSGYVKSGTINQSVPPGVWVLTFVDSSPTHATEVLLTSNVVVGPSK